MYSQKIVILSLVLLAVVMSVWFLPTPTEAQMTNGVLIGWSRTDWDYEIPNVQQDDIFNPKNGFQVGLFLAKQLSADLSLQGEFLYVRKGAREDLIYTSQTGDPLGSIDLFYNADYFQVPVILNYALMDEGGMRPVLMAGPYLAFKYSAKTKGEIPPVGPLKSITRGLEDFSSTDFGLVLGGGLEFSRGGRTFLIQLRYDLGLADSYLTAKNQAWTLMTGIGY